MSEVIEGLRWDVKTSVVKELLTKRIDQCKRKADVFARQAEQQAQLTEQMRKEGVVEDGPVAKHSGDQSENLRAKAAEYTERAKMYQFLVDHVITGSTYRLDRNDLQFLGVVDRNIY
jgi:hypothetical protein